MSRPSSGLDRRAFMGYFAGLGLSSTLLPGVLWARVHESATAPPVGPAPRAPRSRVMPGQEQEEEPRITLEMLADAERIAGLEFTEEERELMLEGLNEQLANYETIRELELPNELPPALRFDPLVPGRTPPPPAARRPVRYTRPTLHGVPSRSEAVAFLPVTHLAELIRTGRMTSVDLARLYLDRLKRHGPTLECVITLTEELALEQARRADAEIAAGRYRGPLHGIPWGAKDLLAVRGHPTTWGANPYREQVIDADATVVRRLEESGAVLVAKLTLGALAWGDVWYDGQTRNPWNPEQGSSGSSAGSAAATAAGLVGFAIGSETWGSIVSPSTRCGTTGLRPTFGTVSRHGAMALSWSMDKLGPICRSVEDCAVVFNAIRGLDGEDPTVVDAAFDWDPGLDVRRLKVAYVRDAFEEEREDGEWVANDRAVLDVLRSLGIELTPIELPDLPISALSFILSAEAAAVFDDLTRSDRDDLMVRQIRNAWPNVFRQSRFIPAVEYIQANRVRMMAMREMARLMEGIDVYVIPSFGGDNLLLTNLTGHPAVVLPNGFREDGTPTSITFMGRLYGEAELMAVARAYQEATEHHLRHPPLFS